MDYFARAGFDDASNICEVSQTKKSSKGKQTDKAMIQKKSLCSRAFLVVYLIEVFLGVKACFCSVCLHEVFIVGATKGFPKFPSFLAFYVFTAFIHFKSIVLLLHL